MKKLVTVCWSYTVEADLPEETTVDDLDSGATPELGKQANSIVAQAGAMLDWKDGTITDVQDI